MGSNQWIYEAMKSKDPKDFDFDEKQKIHGILKQSFGLNALFDEVLFIDRQLMSVVKSPLFCSSKEDVYKLYHVHNPDLLIKNWKGGLLVVEIDGPVHWENSKAVKRTNERNTHYGQAKIKMLWFTRDEVRDLSEAELTLKIIGQGIHSQI